MKNGTNIKNLNTVSKFPKIFALLHSNDRKILKIIRPLQSVMEKSCYSFVSDRMTFKVLIEKFINFHFKKYLRGGVLK
jgi:hypothetical protein